MLSVMRRARRRSLRSKTRPSRRCFLRAAAALLSAPRSEGDIESGEPGEPVWLGHAAVALSGPFRTIRLVVSLTVLSVVLSPSGSAFLNAASNLTVPVP